MRTVLIALFVAGWLAALVAWAAIVVYGLKVIRHVRPGVSPWSKAFGYNPTSVLFRPDLLTQEGLTYRRRLIWALAVFLGVVALTLLLLSVLSRSSVDSLVIASGLSR